MKKPFEIVFGDDSLLVISKIAKLLIHPSSKKEKYTLTSLLQREIKEPVFACHRLDRETTGLVLYAKSKKNQRIIMEQFREGEVKKKYYAFVKGKIKKKQGVLQGYILDREAKLHGERPKKAKTVYRVIKVYNHFSALELKPITGRTNQLRIQLAQCGHPILGERKYAFRRDFNFTFRRLALHAFFLGFIHPVSGERIEIKIDMAADMKEFLILHR